MTGPQETYAIELHQALTERFSTSSDEVSISIEGRGVHWHCEAARGEALCRATCFETDGAPHFHTAFSLRSEGVASGRTRSQRATVDAIADWLESHSLAVLHQRHPFVDRRKRDLERIEAHLIELEPELGRSASFELQRQASDFYHLHISRQDRSCTLAFYGRNEAPDASFAWDECTLFEYQPSDDATLASILDMWVCNRAKPSELRPAFPWLEMDTVADYYEAGRPVEGEFIRSWERIVEFYSSESYPLSQRVLRFIGALRQRGYDTRLRAGQSLWTLVLSRSRRHGMRQDQPGLSFWFHDKGMDAYDRIDDPSKTMKINLTEIALTPQVEAMLDRLLEKDIN